MLQEPFFRPRQLSFFDSLRKDTKNLKQIDYFLCYFIKKNVLLQTSIALALLASSDF